MQTLEPPDSHHLDAALGWLELGSVGESRAELSEISPLHQRHPAVLDVRWRVCAQEEEWRAALEIACSEMEVAPGDPSGWLHRAYALRRVQDGGLAKAWEALLPAAEIFPEEPVIAYNLSCYACRMQQLDLARHWFHRSVAAGHKEALQQMALADEDLQPLWAEIQNL